MVATPHERRELPRLAPNGGRGGMGKSSRSKHHNDIQGKNVIPVATTNHKAPGGEKTHGDGSKEVQPSTTVHQNDVSPPHENGNAKSKRGRPRKPRVLQSDLHLTSRGSSLKQQRLTKYKATNLPGINTSTANPSESASEAKQTSNKNPYERKVTSNLPKSFYENNRKRGDDTSMTAGQNCTKSMSVEDERKATTRKDGVENITSASAKPNHQWEAASSSESDNPPTEATEWFDPDDHRKIAATNRHNTKTSTSAHNNHSTTTTEYSPPTDQTNMIQQQQAHSSNKSKEQQDQDGTLNPNTSITAPAKAKRTSHHPVISDTIRDHSIIEIIKKITKRGKATEITKSDFNTVDRHSSIEIMLYFLTLATNDRFGRDPCELTNNWRWYPLSTMIRWANDPTELADAIGRVYYGTSIHDGEEQDMIPFHLPLRPKQLREFQVSNVPTNPRVERRFHLKLLREYTARAYPKQCELIMANAEGISLSQLTELNKDQGAIQAFAKQLSIVLDFSPPTALQAVDVNQYINETQKEETELLPQEYKIQYEDEAMAFPLLDMDLPVHFNSMASKDKTEVMDGTLFKHLCQHYGEHAFHLHNVLMKYDINTLHSIITSSFGLILEIEKVLHGSQVGRVFEAPVGMKRSNPESAAAIEHIRIKIGLVKRSRESNTRWLSDNPNGTRTFKSASAHPDKSLHPRRKVPTPTESKRLLISQSSASAGSKYPSTNMTSVPDPVAERVSYQQDATRASLNKANQASLPNRSNKSSFVSYFNPPPSPSKPTP